MNHLLNEKGNIIIEFEIQRKIQRTCKTDMNKKVEGQLAFHFLNEKFRNYMIMNQEYCLSSNRLEMKKIER